MPHLDPDLLMLLALGEQQPEPSDTEHLAGCSACRADLAADREVVTVARDTESVRHLPAPPAALWDRISAEAFGSRPVDADGPDPTRPGRLGAPVRPRSPGRLGRPGRLRTALVAVAAAVVAVLGTGTTVWFAQRDSQRVVALADLAPQADAPAGAHGTARVIDTGHGLQVQVTMTGMPAAAGYYTVWIYDGRDVMIPLGSPGTAPLNLPAVADDLRVFHIVDISAQSLGQQQHGRSMLQGVLHS